jgi:hypothetical protein
MNLEDQLLTIFALKSNGDSNMYTTIYMMILVYIVKLFCEHVSIFGKLISNYISERFKRKVEKELFVISNKINSKIIYERNYSVNSQLNVTPDALLEFISNKKEAQYLLYKTFYIPVKKEEFLITKDIYCKILKKDYSQNGELSLLGFEIFSYSLDIYELKTWVESITSQYEIEKMNKFGKKRFYFNEINTNNEYDDSLIFSITEFHTNKTLKNIYGENIDDIKARINLFTQNEEWYSKKGIPHSFGLLLHGPPGTGKTSLIKAISKDTNRHIINFKLQEKTTQKQLFNLFHNTNIYIKNTNNVVEKLIIPLNQRILILEDVDCLTDVVLDRKYIEERRKQDENTRISTLTTQQIEAEENRKKYEARINNISGKVSKSSKDNEVNLSFLLNLLDGVLETPGRIIILTSNFPEKLDSALIRPGRIDLNVKLGNCSKQTIYEIFINFYDLDKSSFESRFKIDDFKNDKFSPALVQSILCNNFKDPERAFKILTE